MHRRTFLKSMGVLAGTVGTGGLLAACGDDEPTGTEPATEAAQLNVIHASLETLAGEGRRFAFGLTTLSNVPVKAAEATVRVRTMDGAPVGEPASAEFHDEGGSPLGLYVARIDVPQAGTYEVEVSAAEGVGTVAISVIAPEDSTVPVPGQAAVATATPTHAAPLGVAAVCTNEPGCGMHEVSLDQALADGRPVALLFATPAYCTSALCAPAVNTLAEVGDDRDWGDVAFVHVEIFSDEGQTVLQAVSDWGLRSEPWFFTIDRDGKVADRIDGPLLASELTQLVEAVA
ncbi:MAG TPA: thioredoxin family protein [Egibacteraceae bacterium]|nr:thioredoxin family protein [Egibacteraceae bacterium]